jgi:hypothetical protein
MASKQWAVWAMAVTLSSSAALSLAATPDISGFWALRNDSKSVPQAQLTPAARQAMSGHQYRDIEGLRWCRLAGMPLLMDGPLNIQQGRIEIAVVSPMTAVARHLYVDGRQQVNLRDFEPTTNGHSVARWTGDLLLVETIGFSDLGSVAIPGGGFRSARSHLVERYRLLAGGNQLSATFTWTDPGVYAKPHSYEFRYYRASANTNAVAWRCEPNDAERGRFFAPALKSFQR